MAPELMAIAVSPAVRVSCTPYRMLSDRAACPPAASPTDSPARNRKSEQFPTDEDAPGRATVSQGVERATAAALSWAMTPRRRETFEAVTFAHIRRTRLP